MAGKVSQPVFTVHQGNQTLVITNEELQEFAEIHRLSRLIPGRYSDLLLVNLYTLERQGVPPEAVIREIEILETGQASYMKPASPFRKKPLKGLWHKHFLVTFPSSMGHNIINQLGENGIKNAVKSALDPKKSDVITPEMISDLVERIVSKPYEERFKSGKLTGEWLIYAPYNGVNYYLCLAGHLQNDHEIYQNVKNVCCREFDWLNDFLESN